MKIIESPLTPREKRQVSGLSGKIAERHGVTHTYVLNIIKGARKTNSKKARAILEDIKETAKFFSRTPQPPKGVRPKTTSSLVSNLKP